MPTVKEPVPPLEYSLIKSVVGVMLVLSSFIILGASNFSYTTTFSIHVKFFQQQQQYY